jgi:hypothetical protein
MFHGWMMEFQVGGGGGSAREKNYVSCIDLLSQYAIYIYSIVSSSKQVVEVVVVVAVALSIDIYVSVLNLPVLSLRHSDSLGISYVVHI